MFYKASKRIRQSAIKKKRSQVNVKRTESIIKDQQVREQKKRIYKPKHVYVSCVYTAHCPPVRTKKRGKNRGRKAKSKGNAKRKGNQFNPIFFP